MDSIIQIAKDLGGPGISIGGVALLFFYFRRGDRELRDETRGDNDRLREENSLLRADNAKLKASNDELYARLWKREES